MKCPHCGHEKSRVTETRAGDDSDRRWRLCLGCARTFATFERVAIYAGRAAGYVELGAPPPPPPPPLEVVPDHIPEPTKKVASTARYQASLDEDCLVNVCAEAQLLLVQWWNESRKSKHRANATWTKAAWEASVQRVASLPKWQQMLLAHAGVEHGWQALKPEYLKDELAKPTGDGRPMPKDPAMLAALESWPDKAA